MNIYNEYKPFRNYMRRFPRFASLVYLWGYAKHVVDGDPLMSSLAQGIPLGQGVLNTHLFPWELEILVREVILNATPISGDLDMRRWKDVAVAVNHIRRLDESISRRAGPEADVLLELHRMAHRQFRWQEKEEMAAIARVLKIYGEQTIDALVLSEVGMTTKQFVTLGAAVAGSFISKWGMSTQGDYAILNISREASASFFDRITCDIDDLRAKTSALQSYDDSWLYARNPLELFPLIKYAADRPDQVICPVPKYALRRATTGLFYDIINSRYFDNPYGRSFQKYVGEILAATCNASAFSLRPESEYTPKKGERRHGIDWILSDGTGHLFIECKAKRMTFGAKTLTDDESLDADLLVMARTIVQTYKNVRDALAGLTNWATNALPIYPLVVTLEDWYLFNPRLQERMTVQIRRLLEEAGINDAVLSEMPYTIASVRELELAAQVIAKVGIFGVMSEKTKSDASPSALLPFLQTQFTEQLRTAKSVLFLNEAKGLIPSA